jgi:hypothetical protein
MHNKHLHKCRETQASSYIKALHLRIIPALLYFFLTKNCFNEAYTQDLVF